MLLALAIKLLVPLLLSSSVVLPLSRYSPKDIVAGEAVRPEVLLSFYVGAHVSVLIDTPRWMYIHACQVANYFCDQLHEQLSAPCSLVHFYSLTYFVAHLLPIL